MLERLSTNYRSLVQNFAEEKIIFDYITAPCNTHRCSPKALIFPSPSSYKASIKTQCKFSRLQKLIIREEKAKSIRHLHLFAHPLISSFSINLSLLNTPHFSHIQSLWLINTRSIAFKTLRYQHLSGSKSSLIGS